MRIALLHYSSPPIVGGVESVVAHHARLMANAGHQVSILVGRGESFDDHIPVRLLPLLDSRHPQIMEVKSSLDRGVLPSAFETLKDQIKSDLLNELNGIDILFAHNVISLHKNLPLTAALHEMYCQPEFPRLVIWHHDLAWTTSRYRKEMHAGYPWDLLRDRWKGAKQVVISQERRKELSKLLDIPAESLLVIPNGVDLRAFYKLEDQTIELMNELKLIEADPLFLLPVRLTPRKNIELAIAIMAELRNQYPHAVLLVTGPEGPHNPANAAYKEKLFELRDETNLQKDVHFLAEISPTFLPDAVIADFYRLADALLFPSLEEGFGIPVIEAAFSSIPVFCADIPVLRELGGNDLSYFDPTSSPVTIARDIAYRLENEATARWARRAKASFSWDSIYRLHIEPLIQRIET